MSKLKSSKLIKEGSIIFTENIMEMELKHIKTMGVVSRVEDDCLYIDHAMSSLEGGSWYNIRNGYPEYEGEYANDCRLVNSEEFDTVIDEGIIPRTEIKNVKIK